MRLFIGIKLDSKTEKKINSYFKWFYENKVTGNYTKTNNLHMTLVFIGETDESKVPIIKDIIKNTKLDINEITIKKTAMLNDILVGEIESNELLCSLYYDLVSKLKQKGFNIDSHKFVPHITLIRKVKNHEKYNNIDINLTSKFDRIVLFESKRINNDLVYIDLGE